MNKVLSVAALVVSLVGCSNPHPEFLNGQVDLAANTNQIKGENGEITVVSRDYYEKTKARGANEAAVGASQFLGINNDLLIGLSRSLFNKDFFFGANVISVRASKNQGMGMLKLSATPSFNVNIKETANSLQLLQDGSLVSEFPVLSKQNNQLLVDFEALGAELNLFKALTNEKSSYEVVSNRTISVNYVAPNLVFDVETAVQNPKDKEDQAVIVTRWYLTENKGHSMRFRQRMPAHGVGHFLSQSANLGTVRAFDLYQSGRAEIVVYAKNFPDVMKVSVENAMEEWNRVFENLMGIRPIKIEYVDVDSPLQKIVMAGDPRFNVIEWDLFNVARYEGFGPCLHDKTNGRNIACSAMIQGPAITFRTANAFKDPSLLQKVFGFSNNNMNLRASNEIKSLALSTGNLTFDIHAFNPELRDEHMMDSLTEHSHDHEEETLEDSDEYMLAQGLMDPPEMDALEYLQSYIQAVIAHEFGHNLGLRHNFKGSMFANAQRKSASIMDYLFTYTEWDLRVEEYDVMAVAYSYAGKQPSRTDMFCTDHQVYSKEMPKNSIECKRFDYTSRPLNFYLTLVDKLLRLSLDNTDRRLPLKNSAGFLNLALEGIVGHAVNAKVGVPTKALINSGKSPEQMISAVNRQLKDLKCSYLSALTGPSLELPVQSDNEIVFSQVFAANTHEFVPMMFSENLYQCN
ncbi:MAG: zinc-dependent metalloprotease [Bdellovibrionota bacterium]|nr:zinc-dependent metalloprotease [Bdellovibrionota bacterium]